jgi:uncharacterized damage-inducible protein DinB
MIDQFRHWFEYEKDSHRKVLASLEAVPAGLRSAEPFQKAVDLMAHIAAARMLWLYRLGVAADGPRDIFPAGVTLQDLGACLGAMEKAWEPYLARLDEAEVARRFEYQSLEGPRFRNSVEEILTQLFGHSWYHRGQIAALVRGLGCAPAVTDLIFWTREPL